MVDLTLSEADKARITAAVTAAEHETAGEIVTIIAPKSDAYEDIATDWAVLIAFLAFAVYALFTPFYIRLMANITGDWDWNPSGQTLLMIFGLAVVIKFSAVKLLLLWRPLRLWMTPRIIKRHRVRAQAMVIFKVTTQQRTSGGTGVLIYLSEDERMAEIIAEEGIHAKVDDAVWGDAMSALVADVKHGRVADGMIAAIARVGAVLKLHFPRASHDTNELPDRVIEL